MDEQLKEIRQILLGRLQKTEDGSLIAISKGEHRQLRGFQGVSAGWGAVRFFGITKKKEPCTLAGGMQKTRLAEAMKTLGRPVQLEKTPEVSACLCQHLGGAPILLIAACEGSCVELSAYTGRRLLSRLECGKALLTLESRLTGTTEAELRRQRTARKKKAAEEKKQTKAASDKRKK